MARAAIFFSPGKAAGGSTDIGAVLSRIDDSMVFTILGWTTIPMMGVRRGMREFFDELSRTLEFSSFDAHDFIAQGDRVVALVHYAGRNKNTGRGFDAESAMIWTIRDGKAVRFVEYTDTDQSARAAGGGAN